MKTIKDMSIKMTYRIGLGNVEVPDKVFDALSKCYYRGGDVLMPDMCNIIGRPELAEAYKWISDNIHENDAMDWKYEIEIFEEK